MPWAPLAERFSSLPLILAGPMLGRTEPGAVTVWLALKESRMVTLRIDTGNAEGQLVQQLEGTLHTVHLVYPGHPLPSFVLPPEDLNHLKILHGSCRKPHGVGKEMLSHS
jgi:hypothetical protein